MLANVKDRHRDIERICHQISGCIRFEDPEENVISLQIHGNCFLCYHRDQFIAQDKGDDQSRNGDDHRLGYILNQIKNPAFHPCGVCPTCPAMVPPAHIET